MINYRHFLANLLTKLNAKNGGAKYNYTAQLNIPKLKKLAQYGFKYGLK
jgi:hypothetical protein